MDKIKSCPPFFLVREAVSLGYVSQKGRKNYCNFYFMPILNLIMKCGLINSFKKNT